MPAVEFVLNGEARRIEVRDGESLLDTLRHRCGIYSAKDGCQPQGQCGCCLVLVDDEPRLSCAIPATKAHGRSVLTLEGLAAEERKLIADSFVAAGGLQCGFCTPGIAMRAKHLLDRNPQPSRDEIAKALDGHLCRCTGYVKIVDAIELLGKARRGEAHPEPSLAGRVGDSLQRYSSDEMTLGMKPYVDDLVRPGMLHGALVLSPHARARVVMIDTSAAESMIGVVAVATARDVPGDRWYGLIERDWPGLVAIGEEVRCVGDVVAVVAAEDRAIARAAAK
ncbi:MAG: 2Fe-2S iron-sulfur cluster-binding protein, partial [Thermoanaerobaculia bacterium]